MPFRNGRASAAIVALLAVVLVASFQLPVGTEAHAAGIDRFLYALGQVESSGRYDARNSSSGAYGKYQIMPANWGPWARKYIGTSKARQSPRNQEIVARGKVNDLHRWLGSWRRVAYWWLTGRTKTSGWSAYASRYVKKVITIYKGTHVEQKQGGVRRYSENSKAIKYGGKWKRAEHPGYRGDAVRQATKAGQTATFRFSGSQVAWNGPKGPTRGKAKVYVDGEYMKTVDLSARHFDPTNRLFTKTFPGSGAHTLTIKVNGTRGRPVVAIDEFLVWD